MGTNKQNNQHTRWAWKRLQKYGTQYASTFDSIITDILNEKEGMSTPEGEGFILK